ncbi:MAG: hypothetical protein BWX80_02461 [Candidatus Hydrogenedentes bacterium ADurb.Bin101]|nr:MAG: hypothetical protein BWX80_02461 [Candidatus Hydrogenedentes bacterium ADurb.Bin101]
MENIIQNEGVIDVNRFFQCGRRREAGAPDIGNNVYCLGTVEHRRQQRIGDIREGRKSRNRHRAVGKRVMHPRNGGTGDIIVNIHLYGLV